MKKIALKIREALHEPPMVSTFVDEEELAPAANASYFMSQSLLDCEVAVVLFCNDFFSSPSCSDEAKVVVEEASNGRFIYLPVFFTATPKDVEQMAGQAWGEELRAQVTQLVNTTGIRHKGEMHDGVQVSRKTTIRRICQAVRALLTCPPASEGAVQAPAAAAAIMAGAGVAAPSTVSVMVATAAPTVGTAQQTVADTVLTAWAGTWLAASANPAVCHVDAVTALTLQPGPSCVFTAVSSSLLTPNAVALVATAMAAVLGYAHVAASQGCVTAVAELPSHSCSPQQLLSWAQQLSQKATPAESAAQGWPTVIAACGAGGLVAWCQQGWGACLAPSAAGLPSWTNLGLTRGRVLPVHSECCGSQAGPPSLGICWHGVTGPNPTLLVKLGPELHAVQLRSTAAGHLDVFASNVAVSRGLADIVADMFPDVGLLLLSVSTGRYFSSTPEAVLVLDVDPTTAAQLSDMVAKAGSFVLRWLHTLLLQPDSQLGLSWTGTRSVGSSGSSGRWDSSSSSIESILAAGVGEFDTEVLQQLQQQLLEPGRDLSVIMSDDLKPWLSVSADTPPDAATQSGNTAAAASEAAAGAAAVSGSMLSVQLAAVRARAAYALLAVAVKQKQLLVVRWLLARFEQQRSWLAQGHCTAEAVLVAQQRIAWSGMLPGFQQPLLALADAVGSRAIVKELTQWSTHHNLPTSTDHFSQKEAVRRAACTWQEQTLPAAGWGLLGLGCLNDPSPQALSAADWMTVGSESNMLQAASLEELASVLGPEGDLSVAVLGGNTVKCVRSVLESEECSQQQLDEALEIAAMLGRVHLLQILLDHGANPTARGAAALAWAEQRQGEPQVLRTLQEGLAVLRQRGYLSSSSSSSSVGHLSVAAWCRGLHKELSGLRSPKTPQPKLQSLQQFLRDAKPGQRTVANLLAQLQQQWPQLFPAGQPSPDIIDAVLRAAGLAKGTLGPRLAYGSPVLTDFTPQLGGRRSPPNKPPLSPGGDARPQTPPPT